MKLFWVDIETTGLNPELEHILEIAVSQAELQNPFNAEPVYHAVMRFDRGVFLSEFIINMHTKNGLLDECVDSPVSYARAERDLLQIVPDVADYSQKPTLAGSSVHFDLGFLRVWMPDLAARFSHRLYDVSAVKLFCRSLGMPELPKAEAHRAKQDVAESIRHAQMCANWVMGS